MEDIAVTDEWVKNTFGDLKNGLYIIFRVEEQGIQDGFILKHYGVTGDNGDKLNLDNHGIERSTNLKETNIKIVSTMLKLGIEENSKLSGMGFVKKDDGIRAFVDVTDGTDPNTIRNRLDNESTINNFFNHNIYDWFIKEKIRQHINDNGGDGNDDDVGKCLDLVPLYVQQTNLQVLEKLLESYKNNTDMYNIVTSFIKNNKDLQSYINEAFRDIFIKPLESRLTYITNNSHTLHSQPNTHEIISHENMLPLFDDATTDDIDKIIVGKEIIHDYNIVKSTLDSEENKVIRVGEYDREKDALAKKSEVSEIIDFYGKIRDNSLDISYYSIKNNDMKIIYNFNNKYDNIKGTTENTNTHTDDIVTGIKKDAIKKITDLENDIKQITEFFKGSIRYFLALPLDDKNSKQLWNKLFINIKSSTKTTYKDSDILSFMFINIGYINKDIKNAIQLININLDDMGKNCKHAFGYTDDKLKNMYFYPYEINDHHRIFDFLFQIVYGNKMSTEYRNTYNDINHVHIADLIQLYNAMKTELSNRMKKQDNYIYTFDTVTKCLQNYFYELKTKNNWWTNMDIIKQSAISVSESQNFSKTYTTINDKKIMSFVKLNNYTKIGKEYDLNKWNLTYQPYISSENQFLKLKVQNYSNELKDKNFIYPDNTNSRTYTFGGFSQVFPPKKQYNKEVDRDAEEEDEIMEMIQVPQSQDLIEKITNSEKVFIFGYGASGAGKTAMLVYNNVTNKDGYCIRLCKEIAKKLLNKQIKVNDKQVRVNNVKLRVNIKEFFYGWENENRGEYFQSKNLIYRSKSNEFDKNNIDIDNVNDAYNYYADDNATGTIKDNVKNTFQSLCEGDEFYVTEQKSSSNFDVPLSFILRKYVTDDNRSTGKRKIEPTRNNPQSSRSHVIIYLDFIVDGTIVNQSGDGDSDSDDDNYEDDKFYKYEGDGSSKDSDDKSGADSGSDSGDKPGNKPGDKSVAASHDKPGAKDAKYDEITSLISNEDLNSSSSASTKADSKKNITSNEQNIGLGSLIIADLAGVENPFDPLDANTIIETFMKTTPGEITPVFQLKQCDPELQKNLTTGINFKGDHTNLKNYLSFRYNPEEFEMDNNTLYKQYQITDNSYKLRNQNVKNGYNPPIDGSGKLDKMKNPEDNTWDLDEMSEVLDGESKRLTIDITNSGLKMMTDIPNNNILNGLVTNIYSHYHLTYKGWLDETNHVTNHDNRISELENNIKENEKKIKIYEEKIHDHGDEPNSLTKQKKSHGNGAWERDSDFVIDSDIHDKETQKQLEVDDYNPLSRDYYPRILPKQLSYRHKIWSRSKETAFYNWRKTRHELAVGRENLIKDNKKYDTELYQLNRLSKNDLIKNLNKKVYLGTTYEQYIKDFYEITGLKNLDDQYGKNLEKLYYFDKILVKQKIKGGLFFYAININDINNLKNLAVNNYKDVFPTIDSVGELLHKVIVKNGNLIYELKFKQEMNSIMKDSKKQKFIRLFKQNYENKITEEYVDKSMGILEKIQYNDTKEKYINAFKQALNNLTFRPAFNKDLTKKIEQNAYSDLLYIMNQVTLRKREGIYINDQLELLRNNMFSSMYYKTDKLLFTAPNIDDKCASSICSGHELQNCFMMKCKKIKNANNFCDFFIDIKNTYFSEQMSMKDAFENIMKSLNILIFTVFNISQKNTTVGETKNNPFYKKNDSNLLRAYRENTQYIDIEQIQSELFDNKSNNTPYTNKILEMFETSNPNSVHDSISQGSLYRELQQHYDNESFEYIIEKLNIHNASTPLGTLIFTDNISKFGLDSICHNTDIDDDNNYSFAIQDRIIQNKTDDEVKEALTKIDFTSAAVSPAVSPAVSNSIP